MPRSSRWPAALAGLIVVASAHPAVGASGRVPSSVKAAAAKPATVKAASPKPARAKSAPAKSAPGPVKAVPVQLSRNAGTPIGGWATLTPDEWPALTSAPVVHSRGRAVLVSRDPGGPTSILRFDPMQTLVRDRTFLALGERAGYLKVLLPIRPNGTVGWVRASDVSLESTPLRVVVELSTNTVTLLRDGVVVLREPVASGSGATPTPQGLFYVVDRIPQADPNGALGPIVLKLSAFSEALTSFAGGQGAIGLHGTSAPGLLGQRVSHGCVRMSNSTISRLASLVPIGTPVEIVQRSDSSPRRSMFSAGTSAGGTTPAGSASVTGPTTSPALQAATVTTVGVGEGGRTDATGVPADTEAKPPADAAASDQAPGAPQMSVPS